MWREHLGDNDAVSVPLPVVGFWYSRHPSCKYRIAVLETRVITQMRCLLFHVTNLYKSAHSLQRSINNMLMLFLQFHKIISLLISPVEWVEGYKNSIWSIIFNVKTLNWTHKCMCVCYICLHIHMHMIYTYMCANMYMYIYDSYVWGILMASFFTHLHETIMENYERDAQWWGKA